MYVRVASSLGNAQEGGMEDAHDMVVRDGYSGLPPNASFPPSRTGPWLLSQLRHVPQNGRSVLSLFSGGGGSSMGYMLSGYNVVGAIECDSMMSKRYTDNLGPKAYGIPRTMMVSDAINEMSAAIPDVLGSLDILDGSPPCSSFSMAGKRDTNWGINKKFREGQADQVLDQLPAQMIKLAGLLRPKLCIMENVKGMLIGNARGFCHEIVELFSDIGYDCQLFLLNASRMGVPQMRERVFFLARRSDTHLPPIKLLFEEPPISAKRSLSGLSGSEICAGKRLIKSMRKYWGLCPPGSDFGDVHPTGSSFGYKKHHPNRPFSTIRGGEGSAVMWNMPIYFSDYVVCRAQTFPDDYDFAGNDAIYICGMSVPPRMMQRLSERLHLWLSEAGL